MKNIYKSTDKLSSTWVQETFDLHWHLGILYSTSLPRCYRWGSLYVGNLMGGKKRGGGGVNRADSLGSGYA